MTLYAGLDISVRSVAICIVDHDGVIRLERSVPSEVRDIVRCLAEFGEAIGKIGFEAGVLSQHLTYGLRAAGYEVVCMEARQVHAALSAMRNKTDRNDAKGIAQILRTGWFGLVHIKSMESHYVRALLAARKAILNKCIDLENEVRGFLKVFGIKLRPRVYHGAFDGEVRTAIEREALQVSHETIYRSLYVQARGALKKELMEHLRTRRAIRRSRHSTMKGKRVGQIADAVSIRERPASAEDRAVPGHWEGDLLCGSKNSFIVTLVERHSRYVLLAKVSNRETQTVVTALIRQARKLPDELYKSLTWDRGKELADHRRFTMETDVAVYFCDPQSPWQRGSNENTNRLLRQYFPRGTDLAPHSQAELNRIARRLNERPRKTLDFATPAERFSACVASTG